MKLKKIPIIFIILQSFLELLIYLLFLYKKFENFKNLKFFWGFTFIYQFFCYCFASFLNPGYLDHSWITLIQNNPNYKEEPSENGEKNFCEFCILPRPSRCHHCRECKKCVKLMDHHCGFIGNCVGQRNFKSFFLFLFSFIIHSILTIFFLILCIKNLIETPFHFIIFFISMIYFIIFLILLIF